jgi:hypothetical protein
MSGRESRECPRLALLEDGISVTSISDTPPERQQARKLLACSLEKRSSLSES